MPAASFNVIAVWHSVDTNITHTDLNFTHYPIAIFASTTGDLFVSNGEKNAVYQLTSNVWSRVPINTFNATCYSLFIDINDTLYCSLSFLHKVAGNRLNNDSFTLEIVVGTGSSGSASDVLHNPYGIFVDTNFDLYVADSGNNRIQRFQWGCTNGTTVVGRDATDTIDLNTPTGIVLDFDRHLFIVDSHNHRIITSGSDGFRCIFGCSRIYGPASSQLYNPVALSFDSSGNIFVIDQDNQRVQKFLLTRNSCSKYENRLIESQTFIYLYLSFIKIQRTFLVLSQIRNASIENQLFV